MSAVHVHRPACFRWRALGRCRRCRAIRRLVITSFVWYGPEVVCSRCGAHVSDGELRRKTGRDSRQAALAAAAWPTLPGRAEFHAWLREAVV